ncbi:hemerythrin-like domain-containing protein [Undibacterium pigrum]|uniref:Hemerythrin-like domain-containing protein n=2 Tax=Undibacterium pigrum TaxID=401470 RepID=A0A318JHQ2_9BURK|nr:hemerythrin-like domain-containing protein [Undibacterium pigrum]
MTQAWPACLLHNKHINIAEVNMTTLFDSAPGFDQPLAVLKHCHDRIRKQLATMSKLLEHLPSHGADQDARQAAQAILNYFTKAAPFHHEDEEINLLPELQVTAKDEDAALLASLLPKILSQHEEMAAQWQELEKQLNAIVRADDGAPASLSAAAVQLFNDLYTEHMQTEETQIAPMAKRLFSAAQMAALGTAMQARRGIAA